MLGIYPGPLHALALVLLAVVPFARRQLVLRRREARDHRLCLSRLSDFERRREDVQDLPEQGSEPARRPRAASSSRERYREFWALRGIDLDGRARAPPGHHRPERRRQVHAAQAHHRNIAPTEGTSRSTARCRRCIEAGGGLPSRVHGPGEHPRSAHAAGGRADDDARAASRRSPSSPSSGEFLGQPFRTYSAGHAGAAGVRHRDGGRAGDPDRRRDARAPATRTSRARRAERMRGLVESGATAAPRLARARPRSTMFCDEAIWLDRGRIVKRGSSLEV